MPSLTYERSKKAEAIMDALELLDTQIQQAITDSMAVEVGDLKLDYQAYLRNLRSEGDRQLKMLAQLVRERPYNLELNYNPYAGGGSGVVAVQAYY